eukprot:3790998-Pleurochrysis_carterae.AAC.2
MQTLLALLATFTTSTEVYGLLQSCQLSSIALVDQRMLPQHAGLSTASIARSSRQWACQTASLRCSGPRACASGNSSRVMIFTRLRSALPNNDELDRKACCHYTPQVEAWISCKLRPLVDRSEFRKPKQARFPLQ